MEKSKLWILGEKSESNSSSQIAYYAVHNLAPYGIGKRNLGYLRTGNGCGKLGKAKRSDLGGSIESMVRFFELKSEASQ